MSFCQSQPQLVTPTTLRHSHAELENQHETSKGSCWQSNAVQFAAATYDNEKAVQVASQSCRCPFIVKLHIHSHIPGSTHLLCGKRTFDLQNHTSDSVCTAEPSPSMLLLVAGCDVRYQLDE